MRDTLEMSRSPILVALVWGSHASKATPGVVVGTTVDIGVFVGSSTNALGDGVGVLATLAVGDVLAPQPARATINASNMSHKRRPRIQTPPFADMNSRHGRLGCLLNTTHVR